MVEYLTLETWEVRLRERVITKRIIIRHCVQEMPNMYGNILLICVCVGPHEA